MSESTMKTVKSKKTLLVVACVADSKEAEDNVIANIIASNEEREGISDFQLIISRSQYE